MAEFLITAPDGKKYKVTGATREGALAALKKKLGAAPVAPAGDTSMGTAFAVADKQAEAAGNLGSAAITRRVNQGPLGQAQEFMFDKVGNPIREFFGMDPVDIAAVNQASSNEATSKAAQAQQSANQFAQDSNFENLTLDSVNDLGSFFRYVGQKGAQAAPYMAVSMASGGTATYPFSVGEISGALEDIEGKTQEEKDKIATRGGAIMTALENLGIASLLPAGVSNNIIGGIASGAISEGFTEGVQELVVIGSEAVAGKEFTEEELVSRLKEATAAGAVVGGSFKAGGQTVNATSNIFSSDGSVNNPDNMSAEGAAAAGAFARRLREIAQANNYDLKDVNANSTKGARETVDKAHIQLAEELKKVFKDLGELVTPDKLKTFIETKDQILAQAAYREARNKTKSTVGQQELDAMRRLVGDTAEGQQAINLMLQLNQLTEVHNAGYKGGLSRITDVFNPLDQNINSYDTASRVVTGTLSPLATAAGAVSTGGASLAPQAALFGTGRAVDAMTGRRSTVDRFVRRNEGNSPDLPAPTAPSLVETKRLQEQQAQDETQRNQEQQKQLNLQLAQQDAPATPGSPQFTMEDATGLSRDGVARILRVLKGRNDNPALIRAIQEYEQSVATGGRIEDLSPLIRAVRQFQQDNPEYVPMVRPPNSLSNPMLATPAAPGQAPNVDTTEANPVQAQTFGPQFTTQENYNRGIESNKAMNAELVEGVTTDPELNRVQKGRLITSLDVLANNLGSDPVAAAQEQVQKLEEAGVPQEAIDAYVKPYVDRVVGQQSRPRMAMAPQEDAPANADLWSVPPQAFNSADTSINSGKLPAGFTELKKQGVFKEGQTVVDIGGGRFDNAVEDLAKQGVTLKVYDPFNRSAMHNETVVSEIANGGADAAVSNNVLNVIQEPENINRVVSQAHNAIPDGGKAYFTVYEGKGDGVGTETSKGWQRNEKTQDYVARIEEVFGQGNVVRKGKVITATKAAAPVIRGETTNIQMPNELGTTFDFAKNSNFAKGRDFKVALQQKALAAQKEEGIDLSELSDENINRLADYVVADALVALQDNSNAIGWYDRTVSDALASLAKIYPEIQTNPANRLQFIWALAVTSNGTKVDKNFELAADAYDHLQRTGRFPTDIGIGEAARAINGGLQQYHTMLDKFDGDHVRLEEFMNSQVPVKQIEQEYGVQISGEGKNTLVRGASILGPKIGNGFFSNLYGNFDALTMDRWLMRTVGRHRGTLININMPMVKKKTGEIKTLLKDASPETMKALRQIFKPTGVKIGKNLSTEDTYRLAVRIAKESTSKPWREGLNEVSVDLRKAGNALAKYLDGQVEAPAGAKERDFIRAVFTQALGRLNTEPSVTRRSNQGLTMSDLQALLWYPEKRLYDTAKAKEGEESRGYADDEAPDYANAARKLAERRQANAIGSGLGSPGPDGPGGGGASSTNARQSQPPVTDGVAGVLASRLAGGPTQRASVPSTQEVKQAAEPARAIIEVGKKGSKYEDGIKDINQVRELADAINVVIRMYSDQRQMRMDAGAPNSTDALGLYEGGIAYALDPTAAGSEFQSYITTLHEVAHGLNDQRYSPGDLRTFSPTQQQNMMGTLAGYPPPMTNKLTGRKEQFRRASFDQYIGMMLSGRSTVPKDLQKKVLKEMKDLQDKGTYRDGSDVRYKGGNKRTVAQRKSTDYYKYIRSTPELAVDPVIYYLHDPKGMKKNYPVTAEAIQQFFRNSSKIQFYSHPLAMAVAVALAMLVKAGQEDEQEKQMPPGALNQPMPMGALSV